MNTGYLARPHFLRRQLATLFPCPNSIWTGTFELRQSRFHGWANTRVLGFLPKGLQMG